MYLRKKNRWLGVFFCTIGCVYAGGAIAADELDAVEQAIGAEPAEAMPTDLFAADDQPLPQGQSVEVGTFGQIDLHVKDLDLTQVLQLLSIQSQRNIIASRNVAGTVSADLYSVDFYQALDAILHTNGFGYREKGQFIYVYTIAEMQALDEADRKLEHKVVRLNYISGADAAAFVSPLLSSAGSISVSADATAGYEPSVSDGGENTFAHADTLIVRDYAENIEEIQGVIKELDIRPKQVLVEATVLQARLNEANAFGVDFSIFTDLNISSFTSPLGAVDELISGSGPGGTFDSGQVISTSPGNVEKGLSSIKVGFVGSDAAVFVRALDSVTDTTVLASPKVLVLNRQKTKLLVGEKLGYLSTTQTETSATQTVEFLDVGTELTLRPFISDDNFVRLEVHPSVSDGDTSRTLGGFVIPEETTQELTTNVIVKSGTTVVLGGLFKEDTSIARSQVPGVGDIPLLGNAFKGQDDTVSRSEVIFLIKPTVMKDENLSQLGEAAGEGIELTRLGARKGLLPWSRTKLTSSQLQQAMKLAEAGDTKKALWHTDLALYLNPTNVDALKLKEKLTGEDLNYYDFSILDNAIENVINTQIDENVDGSVDAQSEELTTPEQEPAIEAEAAVQGDEAETEDAGVAAPSSGEVTDAAVEEESAAAMQPMNAEQLADDASAEAVAEVGPASDTVDAVWDREDQSVHTILFDEQDASQISEEQAEISDESVPSDMEAAVDTDSQFDDQQWWIEAQPATSESSDTVSGVDTEASE
jgi:type IV pilus assembly protein PilQ